ncbi:hypothetical protein V1506DRAFT_389891 [Lipomyces tetrasporus]
MIPLSAATFSLVTLLSGYLISICITPPNPQAPRAWRNDSLWFVDLPRLILFGRAFVLAVTLHHAVIALGFNGGVLQYFPSPKNPENFTWTPFTSACPLIILCIRAPP